MSPTGGSQAPGGVLINLSDSLAKRIEEMIARSHECSAGDAFKSNGNRVRVRQDDDWGAVICASEQVLLNTGPDLPFGDLLVLDIEPLPWTAQDAVRAMGAVMDFGRDLAANMGVSATVAASVATGVFALVTLNLIQSQPLRTENRIPGNQLKGAITPSASLTKATITSSDSSSSSSGPCTASCHMTGPIKGCETRCPGGSER